MSIKFKTQIVFSVVTVSRFDDDCFVVFSSQDYASCENFCNQYEGTYKLKIEKTWEPYRAAE